MLVNCDNCGKEIDRPRNRLKGKKYISCESYVCRGRLSSKYNLTHQEHYHREAHTGKHGYILENGELQHRIIAKVSRGQEVHHRDGNKTNNDPDNLLILSKKDHRRIHGSGELSPVAKYSNQDIQDMIQARDAGESLKNIRVKFGISRAHLFKILKGQVRKDVTTR